MLEPVTAEVAAVRATDRGHDRVSRALQAHGLFRLTSPQFALAVRATARRGSWGAGWHTGTARAVPVTEDGR